MPSKSTTMKTHTEYAHYARVIGHSDEIIQRLTPYLTTGDPKNLEKQISDFEGYLAGAKKDSDRIKIQQNIDGARAKITQYTGEITQANQDKTEAEQQLTSLERNNEVFKSVKQNESLYTIDTDTSKAWCKRNGTGAEAKEKGICQCKLINKKDIAYSASDQVDALRIWNNNTYLKGLVITDSRSYDEAHRDAIQLIPPPVIEEEKKEGQVIRNRMVDQMAGAILTNTHIEDCHISSPKGTLQGIFGSDGFIESITIKDNTINTFGGHFISLAGLLNKNGKSIITGNVLTAKNPQIEPSIHLFPGRLGGNLADDGMIYVLSFSSQDSKGYGSIPSGSNTVNPLSGSAKSIEVLDERSIVPKRHIALSFGLENFSYQGFYNAYTKKTLGQFKAEYSSDFQDLRNWLTKRINEYSHPEQWETLRQPLGKPSKEQQTGVLKILREAKTAIDIGSNSDVRIPELQETPIKTFVLKKLAMHHGKLAKLDYLEGKLLTRRNNMLEFFLDSGQLANMKPKPADYGKKKETKPANLSNNEVEIPAREVEKKLKDSGIKGAYDEAIIKKNWPEKTRLQNIMTAFRETRIWKPEYELKKPGTDSSSSNSATQPIKSLEIPAREVEKKLQDSGMKDAYDEAIIKKNWPEKTRLQNIMTEFRETHLWKPEYELKKLGTDSSNASSTQSSETVEIPAREIEKKLKDSGIKDAYDEAIIKKNWPEKTRLQNIMTEFRKAHLWKPEYELKQSSQELGLINLIVYEAGTKKPVEGEEYILKFEDETRYSHTGVTDKNGSIKLSDTPIGNYALYFTNTEISVSNQ